MTKEQIKLFEKIERCINLIWGLGETYSTVDIDDFVSTELNTYGQHDELFNFIKELKNQAEATKELQEEINKQINFSKLYFKEVEAQRKQIEKMKKCANCNTWLNNLDISCCKNCLNLEGVKVLRHN